MSDDDKELERAILDHEMEPFKTLIAADMARFSSHKPQLLSRLQEAYNRGTKAQPFDSNKSWFRIETIAYQYFARTIIRQKVVNSAAREARYRAISDALKQARENLDKTRWPDVAGPSIKAWLEGTKELTDATEQYLDQLDIEVEFERLRKSLTELEAAANEAAKIVHKGPGRPKGSSVLPWNYVYALAGDYRQSTGRRPGTRHGPFSRFVSGFLTAIGQQHTVSDNYAIDVIREARTEARNHPNRPTPSPFDK